MGNVQRAKRTCSMVLRITQEGRTTSYAVKPIPSDMHVRAYQVRRLEGKPEGMVYHVTQELGGRRDCDCGAAVYRDQPCKHIKSAEAMGMLLTNKELLALQQSQPLDPTEHTR